MEAAAALECGLEAAAASAAAAFAVAAAGSVAKKAAACLGFIVAADARAIRARTSFARCESAEAGVLGAAAAAAAFAGVLSELAAAARAKLPEASDWPRWWRAKLPLACEGTARLPDVDVME